MSRLLSKNSQRCISQLTDILMSPFVWESLIHSVAKLSSRWANLRLALALPVALSARHTNINTMWPTFLKDYAEKALFGHWWWILLPQILPPLPHQVGWSIHPWPTDCIWPWLALDNGMWRHMTWVERLNMYVVSSVLLCCCNPPKRSTNSRGPLPLQTWPRKQPGRAKPDLMCSL